MIAGLANQPVYSRLLEFTEREKKRKKTISRVRIRERTETTKECLNPLTGSRAREPRPRLSSTCPLSTIPKTHRGCRETATFSREKKEKETRDKRQSYVRCLALEATHTRGIRITVGLTDGGPQVGIDSDEEENETVAQGEGRFREAWGSGVACLPKGSGTPIVVVLYANKEV